MNKGKYKLCQKLSSP